MQATGSAPYPTASPRHRTPRAPSEAASASTAERASRLPCTSESTAYRTHASAGGPQLFVDAVEDSVAEAARLLRAELLRHLERLVDGDLGRHVTGPENLEDAFAQDVPVHHRHALELPVLRVLGDQLVDLLLVELGPAHEGLGEIPYLDVHGMARRELAEVRPGRALALDVQLVEQLERQLAGLAALAHQRRRFAARPALSSRLQATISSTARAASSPRCPTGPPARSHACASVSEVITPKPTGTPVSSPTRDSPWAASAAMYPKCGVLPRITTPTETMPAYRPARASAMAACGSSNEPGTQWISTRSPGTPPASSAEAAPSASFFEMASLKRAATTAKRPWGDWWTVRSTPCADFSCSLLRGAAPAISIRQGREEVAHLLALGHEVALVALGGRHVDGHDAHHVES